MIQFKALLIKELKEAFRDKWAMLSDVSAMMICSATRSATRSVIGSVISSVKGVTA